MAFHKKDQFGQLKDPKLATENFKMGQLMGAIPANQTRQQADARYRKKLNKKKAEKQARRKNRRR